MRGNHGRPTPIHQDSVLPWLTETQGATPTPLPLRVQPTATAGNALIATSDVPAGAPLLTLPCDACIVQPFDNAPDDTSALGPMALALLQRLAAGTDPWLDALPRRVDLPWLTWEPQELAALQDIETRQEAAHLQQCLMQLYQVPVLYYTIHTYCNVIPHMKSLPLEIIAINTMLFYLFGVSTNRPPVEQFPAGSAVYGHRAPVLGIQPGALTLLPPSPAPQPACLGARHRPVQP